MFNVTWPPNALLNNHPTLQQFRSQLSEFRTSNHSDKIEWKWFLAKKFSTNQCYEFLLDGGIRPYISRTIWKIKIPKKIKFFLYLAFHDKILTRSNLAKWGWKGKNICPHEWSFSREVWLLLLHGLQPIDLPTSLSALWINWRSHECRRHLTKGLDILLAARLWSLWKEQN